MTDTVTAIPTRGADVPAKLARLHELLDARGVESLALTGRESLAWLLDGARVTVPLGGDPVLSAIVRRDGVELHILRNENDRLLAEELPDLASLGIRARTVAWFDTLPGTRADDGAADLREAQVAAELRALRARLLPGELARYRALGSDLATALTDVLAGAGAATRERDLTADLARALIALGAEPVVLLVAGEGRLDLRHPLPTDAPIGRRAMTVVGARRNGLIVNLTRWLGDEPGSAAVARRLLEVEADAFAATRPGRRLADVLADIAASYERHGFDRDEWLRHHQGGPTGYAGRDPKAGPATGDLVVDGQAYAWNPTTARQKIEDTVVVAGGRVEVLTVDERWPTVDVRGLARPDALPLA
ncbi:M24 family metallopeptidase [Agromyces larvae]|uniref:Peptidase M24 n=1 Tax=Agromyces larvae TaxID=2929802 RepID=A0ABY4C4H5_9MICO|nr:peptidase M24 [Agromyces larvae]UOE43660.1 peptidase M24 [Agromyces larvae]